MRECAGVTFKGGSVLCLAQVHRMSNIGYDYALSLGCLSLVVEGRKAAADFLNCEPKEVSPL